MFGLGKKKRMQQAATPGILPGFVPNAPAPTLGTMDKLGSLGAMLMDADGTLGSGHFARAKAGNRDKLAQIAAQQQQGQQGILNHYMVNGTPQQQRAAAQYLNPSAAAAAMLKQQFGHHTVGAGDTLVTYGPNGPQMTQAAQTFQDGSNIGRLNPDGSLTQHSMGANADNMVDMRAQDIGLQETQIKDATTRRGQDVDRYGIDKDFEVGMGQVAVGHGRNAVGRERNAIDREAAAFERTLGGGAGKRSLNPIYGTDADGNPVVMQLTSNGQLLPAAMTDGITPLGPEGRALASAKGKARGTKQAADEANAPNMAQVRAEIEALAAGDLSNGFEKAYGLRVPFVGNLPGERRDANAAVDRLVSGLTLESLESMKGVPSDKDAAMAGQARTVLGDRNVSDKKAQEALIQAYELYGGNPDELRAKLKPNGKAAGLTDAEEEELRRLEAEFGG